MSKHFPPVPPQNQSHKGTGDEHRGLDRQAKKGDARQRDLAHQGRQGNIKQNTTNQGFQQDR